MMYSDGKNTYLLRGGNMDVISAIRYCYDKWKDQPEDILSPELYELPVRAKCEAIFDYLIKNTSYLLDDDGKQYIKSPARLLADGTGDCKSLTMFLASCLHCLGVPHIIRFVDFEGDGLYGHVYAVAIDENGKEIILDACEKDKDGRIYFDYARPYIKKKDLFYNE